MTAALILYEVLFGDTRGFCARGNVNAAVCVVLGWA